MEFHENRMFNGMPKTPNDWSEARRAQGLDNVHIRTTVKCLVGLDIQPHPRHRTPEFCNFQTYIAVTYCYILYNTGHKNAAIQLMQQIFPNPLKPPKEETLIRYQQLVAKLVKWMATRSVQSSKYPVFEGIFHAAISVPKLMKISEAVLDDVFETTPEPSQGVQIRCLIPLCIPFLVHSRVAHMSFEKMCRVLKITYCQHEYDAWLKWLYTDEILNTPGRLRLNAMQPNGSDNTPLLAKSYETLSAHEIAMRNHSGDNSLIETDLRVEKKRERPNNIDFFLGDVIDLELYAAELLQPLEHYITAPLSSLSILKSQLAFRDTCNNKTGTPVEQYDWLQCHEDLADQVCEDLMENGIMRRTDLCRLPVAIHREANVRAGTNTPRGWIQIVAQIAEGPGGCEIMVHHSHDKEQTLVIGTVTWKAKEVLIFDEEVSFTPDGAIDYIAMAFPKP